MGTTIRNLDSYLYRTLKARAALEGKGTGEVVNEAIAAYLNRPPAGARTLADLTPEAYPTGCGRLSEEIDATAYGEK